MKEQVLQGIGRGHHRPMADGALGAYDRLVESLRVMTGALDRSLAA